MNEQNFCCGKIPQRKNIEEKELPDNPEVSAGVAVVYLGSGYLEVKGISSGLIYYVSDHRRKFLAREDDLKSILKRKDFILKP
ncbi:MAG: hypothetical protein J0M18_12275 [Ignavibacteria bacterium]|nr:hypothetical protein [Ignavibacteria bacterium]